MASLNAQVEQLDGKTVSTDKANKALKEQMEELQVS